MPQIMCIVTLEEDGSVSIIMPLHQDAAFYTTVAALVLDECIKNGTTMEYIMLGVDVVQDGENTDVEIVPEPIVMG